MGIFLFRNKCRYIFLINKKKSRFFQKKIAFYLKLYKFVHLIHKFYLTNVSLFILNHHLQCSF